MADFVNQAILQQLHARGAGPDPQAQLMQEAHLRLQQQQAAAAQKQRDMNQGLTALEMDWVPIEDKVRIANNLGKQFGIQGEVTADGIQPYRQLLTDMLKDMEDGKDLSRWETTVNMFVANPKFVDPSKRQAVFEAQQQLQEQKVQQVATAQVPSVEGGPEAMGRTQEARGRLALFDSITPDDPDAAQKVEAFTNIYGSVDRLHQQIEADRLVVQDEDMRRQEREKYAAALRLAPAELAKQAAASVDPKTMLLPVISKAIQRDGIDGLTDRDRKLVEAHYVLNGQPEKLAFFSEGAKVNELKRYQQDLQDTNVQLGAITQVQKVLETGKERIGTYEAAAQDALSIVENHGATMPAASYEERQAALDQLKTATETVVQDWEETIAPVRQELSKGAESARQTVQELNKQLSRPGVDRVTLSKRKDFYQQQADTYEQMNATLGLSSDVDVAMKRNEIRALEIDAKVGESPEARQSAQALIPKRKQELAMLEQQVEKNKAVIESSRERLTRFAKLSQARITAGDRKLEQAQQNGMMASTFLAEAAGNGFKTNPETWYTQNAKFFDGADPKQFMEIVDPVMKSRKEINQALAERELLAIGDPKQAGPIAAKYGVKPSDIMGVLKDPNKPMVEVNMAGKASEEAAKDFTKSTRATYDQLKSAPILLRNIDEAKALIPQAKGFMGPGGESMLEAAKFLNARIGAKINTEGVKSAEELRTRIFFNIMENLKKMDAQPSEMQQMMMRDALGKLGTDPNALANVLDAYGDTIRDKVELFNNEVAGAEKKGTQFPYDPRIILPPRKSATGELIIKSEEEYNKLKQAGQLPSGTVYIRPDGKKMKAK